MALVATRRALLAPDTSLSALLASSQFYAPLYDLGAGLVATTLSRGTGAATFVRATVAWTKLSTGLWSQIATGTARSTYLGANTAVGSYGGYFAEGAATQLVTPTASIRDMTDASWVKVTMTTAKTSTGIDGVGSSCTRCTASGANATILQTLVAAATTRTYSCWIRRITGSGEIDISEDGSTWTNITGQINSSTFTRVSVTTSQLNAAFGIRIVVSTDAIDVDFNQFESGSFATSPMASAGAARNADVLTYVFSGNSVAAQGTCYAELSLNSTSTGAVQFAVASGTATGPLNIASAAAATTIQASDGTNNIAASGLTDMSTAMRKRASSWIGTALSVDGDGVAATTGAFDGDIGSTAVGIGCASDGTLNWFGTVANVRLWNRALNVRAMTT